MVGYRTAKNLIIEIKTESSQTHAHAHAHAHKMTERFDLVVFGASGFTGNYVAKLLDERKVKYSVALAGRR